MKRKFTSFLACLAIVTALSFTTAGTASATLSHTQLNTPIPVGSGDTWTGDNTNDMTYSGGWNGAGPSARFWNLGLGDGNRGFAGTNFTLSENASVTMKVTAFTGTGTHGPSDTTIYLYEGGFDRTKPTVNRVSVGGISSWDGLAGITMNLLTGKNYTFVVSTDNAGTSSAVVTTSEITAVPASTTPIPAAAWLLGSGLLGLVGIKKKRS